MADDLKRSERTVAPEVRQDRPLARVQAVPWLIVIVLLAAVAWLGWRAFFYQEEGDPVGSAMLAFEKQNSLTVFSSRFEVVAESVDRRGVLLQVLAGKLEEDASLQQGTLELPELPRLDRDVRCDAAAGLHSAAVLRHVDHILFGGRGLRAARLIRIDAHDRARLRAYRLLAPFAALFHRVSKKPRPS